MPTVRLVWGGALALLLSLGCAAPQTVPADERGTGSTPRYGGTLHVRVANDPLDWDATFQGPSNPGAAGYAQGYNGLLGFKHGPGIDFSDMQVGPELAERWEVSPDGKAYTFHLRKGVKFHNLPPVNGRELTAADVKWTVEYYTRTGEFQDKGLPMGQQIDFMYDGLDRVETPDPYTAVVRFSEPYVPFLAYSASDWNPIVPREIYQQDGHLKDRLVGTGPFVLDTEASQKGTRWVWKKHAGFWDTGKPYLDEIRWLVLAEEATTFAAFQTKQLDVLDNVAYQAYQQVKSQNPQAVEHQYLSPQGLHLYLGQRGPLQDIRLRRAISLAVDRDEVNRVMAGGKSQQALPGAMPGLFTDAEARGMNRQDLNEARRLVAEAGYSGGIDLEWPMVNTEAKANVTWFELVQAQVKRAGINIHLKPLEKNEQRTRRRSGQFDLDALSSLGVLEADIDSGLYGVYHSASTGNASKVKDADLDKLLLAQRSEANPEKRRALQRDAVKRIVEMVWGVELIYPPKWDFSQPYLKNYHPHFSVKGPYIVSWLDK